MSVLLIYLSIYVSGAIVIMILLIISELIPQTVLALRGSHGVDLFPRSSHICFRGGSRGAVRHQLPGSSLQFPAPIQPPASSLQPPASSFQLPLPLPAL